MSTLTAVRPCLFSPLVSVSAGRCGRTWRSVTSTLGFQAGRAAPLIATLGSTRLRQHPKAGHISWCFKAAVPLLRTSQHCRAPAKSSQQSTAFSVAASMQGEAERGGEGGLQGDTFFLDEFALRQWDDPAYSGTHMTCNKGDFVRKIEEYHQQGTKLEPGYADFCKHLFVPNFAGARAGHLRIDASNEGLLRSGYKARSGSELPVLTRWFPSGAVSGHETKMLDAILYSRDQLLREQKATASRKGLAETDLPKLPAAPWGIISIKAQDEAYELPMSPITIMRNALGAEEGGSGVPLDRDAYLASVKYWDQHAMIQ